MTAESLKEAEQLSKLVEAAKEFLRWSYPPGPNEGWYNVERWEEVKDTLDKVIAEIELQGQAHAREINP